jgi:SAM-dependent methyltransferase
VEITRGTRSPRPDARLTDLGRSGAEREQALQLGVLDAGLRPGRRSVEQVDQPADLEDVRASYDRVADAYVDLAVGRLDDEPWLRAALDAFAEAVAGLGPVLDVGCGPGHVTAHLSARGLDARGVDLSPRMVEHARRRHPGLRFDVAGATDLDLTPGSLGGVLGWWSLFHLPRAVLPEVIADFTRALVPGGQVLIGTHVGDQDVPRRQAYGGVPVSWTTHRWLPEQLVEMVVAAGLEPVAELRFPASGEQPPQVVLAARRPAPGVR